MDRSPSPTTPVLCCACSKYDSVIGAGAGTATARELSSLAREDAYHQPHQQQDTFALEQLVHPLQSTTASALIPYQQVT